MNIDKEVKIKPFRILIIILALGLVSFTVYNYIESQNKSEGYKELQRKNDSLEVNYKKLKEVHLQDSIIKIEYRSEAAAADSLRQIAEKREQYFKDQSFKNFKKWKNEQKNYNNANDVSRDSLAAIIAKRKG